MYGFQQKIIHGKKKKREELRYHRTVGTKKESKGNVRKKNRNKECFWRAIGKLNMAKEKSVSLKTEEKQNTVLKTCGAMQKKCTICIIKLPEKEQRRVIWSNSQTFQN